MEAPDWSRIEPWPEVTDEEFRPSVSFLRRDADGAAVGVLVTMSREAGTEAAGIRDAHFMVLGRCRGTGSRGARVR